MEAATASKKEFVDHHQVRFQCPSAHTHAGPAYRSQAQAAAREEAVLRYNWPSTFRQPRLLFSFFFGAINSLAARDRDRKNKAGAGPLPGLKVAWGMGTLPWLPSG